MRRSKRCNSISALGLVMLLMALGACGRSGEGPVQEEDDAASAKAEAPTEEQIRRGQYLVTIGGCHDCHTPTILDEELDMPRPDMSRMLSGHPKEAPDPEGSLGPRDSALIGPTATSFTLPFGTVYATNLTPDMDTGIGSWTEGMFLAIFRKGRHLGGNGRGVLPPMPWAWIRNLNDDDLRAMFAYLNSIPAVRNAVPEPTVPEEVMWKLRDGFDRIAAELPQEDWAAGEVEAAEH